MLLIVRQGEDIHFIVILQFSGVYRAWGMGTPEDDARHGQGLIQLTRMRAKMVRMMMLPKWTIMERPLPAEVRE